MLASTVNLEVATRKFPEASSVPSTAAPPVVRVRRSALPLTPIWLSVMRTSSTSTYCPAALDMVRPVEPEWVIVAESPVRLTAPKISVLPLVPVTLNLLVFTAKSEVTSIVLVTVAAPFTVKSLAASAMRSSSLLTPICAFVNRTDSTSTYVFPASVTGPVLLEIARLPDAPSWVMTPLAAFIVRLPRISVLPLVPVTLNLLVFTARSPVTEADASVAAPVLIALVTVADSSVASPPVVILCENATVPSLLLVDRVMMSTSPLSPICAPVNRTDSMST